MSEVIGYARTSTVDQIAGFEAQLRDLEAAGCTKIFREQVSSVAPRAQLEAALTYAREGDTFRVTKLDRLARSIRDLLAILDLLERKKVTVQILDLGLDTSTAIGKLILTLLGAIAEFERAINHERQREGIEKARRDGKYKGRTPVAFRQRDAIRALRAGGMGASEIALKLGVARSSVYRMLEDFEPLADAAD